MTRRWIVGVTGAVLGATLSLTGAVLPVPPQSTPAAEAAGPATYQNPVTEGTVDTFPDPAMMRGKDGYWYAYGTTNPVFNSRGERVERVLPIVRSADMVEWEFVGEVFTREEQPAWWAPRERLWAPDIRYVDGEYYLTYSLASSGVGLATADSPAGPWRDEGLLIPRSGNGCTSNAIDQAYFTDDDGSRHMIWGSYDRICIAEMSDDARSIVGEVTTIAQGRRMEGGFMVQRDGYYYLFYSDAGCCDGEFSGYTVKVGRSESPRGPFVDDRGVDLMALGSKAGFVLAANGNRWIGPGHNAIQTDVTGQDWMVYHAIPVDDPEFGAVDFAPTNLSVRPMLIDRLDWIDGWPVVNGGAGPTETPQTAPVTDWAIGTDFDGGLPGGWRADGGWSHADVADAEGVLLQSGQKAASYESSDRLRGDVRAETDVRLGAGEAGRAGVALTQPGVNTDVRAFVDRASGQFVLETVGKSTATATAPLPARFDYESWHLIDVEVRGTEVHAELSEDGLGDPVAITTLSLDRAFQTGVALAAVSEGTPAEWNALGLAGLYTPSTAVAPVPQPGELLAAHSTEFDGTGRPEQSDAAWSWVRGASSRATLVDGALSWPTQNAELFRTDNTASVLLRDAPEGDFIVETKLDFAPTVGNQQAGLLLYETDDRFFKLTHSKLPLAMVPNTFLDVTEFGKEGPRPGTTPPTAVAAGPAFGAMPADVTWLRLAYHFDADNQEHEVRMASSVDGETWSWGTTWTLPATTELKIGLVSMNRVGALAEFDYVRTYAVE